MGSDFIEITVRIEITSDEKNFVQLLANGNTVYAISKQLNLNVRHLENKLFRLRKKVSARNNNNLITIFLRNKFIE